jgi:hypothetical protein
MRITIKSKAQIEYSFWAPDNGGYVRLEGKNAPGTVGQQICRGGGFSGSTISCTPDNFRAVCRKWLNGK